MAEVVTLTLSEQVMDQAREVAQQTGRTPEAILADRLEQDFTDDQGEAIIEGIQLDEFDMMNDAQSAAVLMRFLAESNERNEAQNSVTWSLKPGHNYPISSPYRADQAGQVLHRVLRETTDQDPA